MNSPLCIKAVLFDFDGTLTKPGAIDFTVIRQAINCPADTPILEFIESLTSPDERDRVFSVLHRFEIEAAAQSEPNHGAEELVRHLRSKALKMGIITRNSRTAIERALNNFQHITAADFDVIISRDDPAAPKPSADGIRLAASRMQVRPEEILMVGDYVFDIEAGNRAGSPTVHLTNRIASLPPPLQSDYTISNLEQLKTIVRLGTALPAGKLPNDLLKEFLGQFVCDDPSVLIQPGVGDDTAAVDVAPEEVVVLKSDPITFVTDSIGAYAVIINANDIATSGAVPRWFLTSLLFPINTTPDGIQRVMRDIAQACRRWGITLCGGHTEITDVVTRPIVTGMLVGTVAKINLIDKKNMRTGDMVLMTKGAGIEGTAIIARECGDRLKALGMQDNEIMECGQYLFRISILEEARLAARSGNVSAMHDVTEGGIATALEELSAAGGCKIRINMDKISVYPRTAKLCHALSINPLGLIGSGCLLICCEKNTAERLQSAILEAGIDVTCIGEVLEKGQGIEAYADDKPVPWPHFDVDELARFFHGRMQIETEKS